MSTGLSHPMRRLPDSAPLQRRATKSIEILTKTLRISLLHASSVPGPSFFCHCLLISWPCRSHHSVVSSR